MMEATTSTALSGAGEGLANVMEWIVAGISLGVLMMVVIMKPPAGKPRKRQKRLVFLCRYCQRWHGTDVWYEPGN